eukprot:PhF_6_TR7063/c1_g1_i13/m.10673
MSESFRGNSPPGVYTLFSYRYYDRYTQIPPTLAPPHIAVSDEGVPQISFPAISQFETIQWLGEGLNAHVYLGITIYGDVALKIFKDGQPTVPAEVMHYLIFQDDNIVPPISYECRRRIPLVGSTDVPIDFQHRLCLKLMHHSLEKDLPIQDESTIRKIIRDVLKGLHHMHCQGYYHNDIKPQNIFIHLHDQVNFKACIGDLGSVTNTTATKLQNDEVTRIIPEMTQAYMSPEALWGWTPRAANDFWALGITMLQMWLGQLPFDFTRNVEFQISYDNMVSKIPAGLSPDARDFVELLLRADTDPSITIEQLMSHPFVNSTLTDRN